LNQVGKKLENVLRALRFMRSPGKRRRHNTNLAGEKSRKSLVVNEQIRRSLFRRRTQHAMVAIAENPNGELDYTSFHPDRVTD
jgi:hypothetical protein